MASDADSFTTYIDHLILVLAARFQAPLETSVDELLSGRTDSSAAGQCPWELVARAVQQALCTPQTAQERSCVRQLDVHHFSAAVCRERARYVQWRLRDRQHPRGERQCSPQRVVTASAAGDATEAAATDATARPYDVTRDSLHNDVLSLYALVRQSLPSALDDSDSDDEGEGAAMPVANAACGLSTLPQVNDVHVRTAAEQERDAQAARARDEFLTQVQALQAVYYDKYRRWMDVPASVLDPPPSASSASPASVTASAVGQQVDGESERAALLAALGVSALPPPSMRSQPRESSISSTSSIAGGGVGGGSGAVTGNAARAVTAAPSVFRHVQLRRPLRPSAVSDDVLESLYRTTRGEPEHPPPIRSTADTSRGGVAKAAAAVPPSAVTVVTSADTATVTAAAPSAAVAPPSVVKAATATAAAPAAVRETSAALPPAPAAPAHHRRRWQIVEYSDGEDE